MKMGTRSLLFGAHQVLIHPCFVAASWIELYGWPWDPRYWLSFLVHDWGYWGKAEMDSPDGEKHPILGAVLLNMFGGEKWLRFCLYHSRFLARYMKVSPSRLCLADKLAIANTPVWLYLFLVRLSGEAKEYMALAKSGKYDQQGLDLSSPKTWFANVQANMRQWVKDANTPEIRRSRP